MKDINLGFIGYGNMAQAIATGLRRANTLAAERIYACAARYEKLCRTTQVLGIHPARDAREIAEKCDYIILAVKPHLIEDVLAPIRQALKGKVLISIAAGYDFERYTPLLEDDTHHISTIPNTPIAVCEGICVCEDKHSLTEEEYQVFTSLFDNISRIVSVPAKQFSAAGTLSGCTPAFSAMYIEALADAGVKYGIARDTAYQIAAQVIVGTGALCLSENLHPGILKDQVCSPGGTTIRGVSSLENSGFRGSVIRAIDAIEGN